MRTIFKYEIIGTELRLNLPGVVKVRHVGVQRGKTCLWIEHDTEGPVAEYCYVLVGTGGRFPDQWKFVGTFLTDQEGTYVFHVYEVYNT